jgi:hypothetical protein
LKGPEVALRFGLEERRGVAGAEAIFMESSSQRRKSGANCSDHFVFFSVPASIGRRLLGGSGCAFVLRELFRLRECGSVGDSVKVAVDFILLHGDGFEEEDFAVHIDFEFGDGPVGRRDFFAMHIECAAGVKMA